MPFTTLLSDTMPFTTLLPDTMPFTTLLSAQIVGQLYDEMSVIMTDEAFQARP